jgi:hypothetical protein
MRRWGDRALGGYVHERMVRRISRHEYKVQSINIININMINLLLLGVAIPDMTKDVEVPIP